MVIVWVAVRSSTANCTTHQTGWPRKKRTRTGGENKERRPSQGSEKGNATAESVKALTTEQPALVQMPKEDRIPLVFLGCYNEDGPERPASPESSVWASRWEWQTSVVCQDCCHLFMGST